MRTKFKASLLKVVPEVLLTILIRVHLRQEAPKILACPNVHLFVVHCRTSDLVTAHRRSSLESKIWIFFFFLKSPAVKKI